MRQRRSCWMLAVSVLVVSVFPVMDLSAADDSFLSPRLLLNASAVKEFFNADNFGDNNGFATDHKGPVVSEISDGLEEYLDQGEDYLKEILSRERRLKFISSLEGGKRAVVYSVRHSVYGRAIVKIVTMEIGIEYGTSELFVILDHYRKRFKDLSPFPAPYELIFLPKLGLAVIVQEMLEEYTRDDMMDMLEERGLSSSEALSMIREWEMRSLARIWRESFRLPGFEGMCVDDIVSQDVRYIRSNGEWVAKFVDLEERKFYPNPADFVYFYTQTSYEYEFSQVISALMDEADSTARQVIERKITASRAFSEKNYPAKPVKAALEKRTAGMGSSLIFTVPGNELSLSPVIRVRVFPGNSV